VDVPNGKEVDAECCDMSVIQPTVIRDSENTMSAVAMSKVLLERLLLRKELRLRIMQEKQTEDRQEEQTMELEEAKKKLAEYEKMFGFKKFQFLSKLFSRIIWFGVRRVSGVRRGGVRAVSSFYQVNGLFANIKTDFAQVNNYYHFSLSSLHKFLFLLQN
jgi:hypothetical protein